MSECSECGSTENIDEHHTSYQPETTVHLCRRCHQKVHADPSHPLNPDDAAEMTTVQIDDGTKEKLRDERLPHETNYAQTVERLLGESDTEFVTEADVRAIVVDEIQAQARR